MRMMMRALVVPSTEFWSFRGSIRKQHTTRQLSQYHELHGPRGSHVYNIVSHYRISDRHGDRQGRTSVDHLFG